MKKFFSNVFKAATTPINRDFGSISTVDGNTLDIKPSMSTLDRFRLAGDLMLIGIGIFLLVDDMFMSGANAFSDAEYETMDKLDLFKN